MEFMKKQMHINRMEKGITDQFFVDDDYNVPDAKRDVSKIVMSKGEAKVEEMKPLENYVRVAGNVYFQILYVTEEGETKLTSLEGKCPFEEMVYVENGVEEGTYTDGIYGVHDPFTKTEHQSVSRNGNWQGSD